MRLLQSLLAFAALLLGPATIQAQFFPQPIGEWEITAGFRALDRPTIQDTDQVVFSDTNTGATLLDAATLTDLNVGLGPDIAFSTTREDGIDYELRFFFSLYESDTLTQAPSISSPFFGGLTPSQVIGNYSSDVFNLEFNQKRIISPYFRVLHGIRFLSIEEKLSFDSTGTIGFFNFPFSATSLTRSKNPMLGYQIGGESRIKVLPGIDIEGFLKAGVYNNFSSQSTTQTVSFLAGSIDSSGSESRLAFVTDFGGKVHWNIVENFMSFYAGYDGMYISNFAPAPANVSLAGGVENGFYTWLHGINLGFKVVR